LTRAAHALATLGNVPSVGHVFNSIGYYYYYYYYYYYCSYYY
jgi:hypothetical protein